MSTLPWRHLHKRIAALNSRFIPPISATGAYSAKDYDGVRAFIVLTHAEIESYLEESAALILDRSIARWAKRFKVNRCLSALMLHYDKSHTPKNGSFSTHIHCAGQEHHRLIRRNHGIKEENVIGLFGPLGLEAVETSPTLWPLLDSFGVARGEVAHSSARKVKSPPDPGSTVQEVSLVIDELRSLDSLIPTLSQR